MPAVRDRISTPGAPLAWATILLATFLLSSCSSLTIGNTNNAAAISASASSVRVTQHVQLSSPPFSYGGQLIYYVNGIQGGSADVGTVNASGLYTAPAVVPQPNSVEITATSTAFPNAPPGKVNVAVLNPIPVIHTVTPTGFSEGTVTVAVNGSQFVYGSEILWNGAAVQTTLVSDSQLVAEVTAPKPGTFPLTVRNPNPGAANANNVSIKVGPGQVVLQVNLDNGADVRVGNSLGIGLNVNGTLNTAVKLDVNGIPGGNAEVGTAVSNRDGSITYHAPQVVPTPSNVVLLNITSVDNPKVSIQQNISVMNPIPLLYSATPSQFNPGPATIVLSGNKFIKGASVLVNGAAAPTTFNSATQLTAKVDQAEPGNLDLQVLNPAPGPAASTDLVALVKGTPPTPIVSEEDAARFLEQATFGATDSDIHHLSMVGYQAWLNEQFNMPQTLHEPDVEQQLILNNPACAPDYVPCNVRRFGTNANQEEFVQDSIWQQALAGNDQLRQRMKYTLSQLFVISGTNYYVRSMPRGEANYYDLLGKDAFTNFNTLLTDVTLNPMMGQWLSMLQNDKGDANTDPDENYAREIMQLFTIGLWELNDDGSQKLDNFGNPIPTYSNTDVMGLAKVFTGYSWGVPNADYDQGWWNCCVWMVKGDGEDLHPMRAYPEHHSTEEKTFLGHTIPASASSNPQTDLIKALSVLVNHPNVPPFISKQLIQHLVTSNPSPAYINRVAQVFKNNGKGVRGDMKAVITAILLDPEARDTAGDASNPEFGKVREALLRYTEWARAFTAQSRTGSYWLGSTEDPIYGLGEMTLRSPTVFNWFTPGYVPPNTSIEKAGLGAPEMQMTNVSTVVGYINYMQDAIGSDSNQGADLFSNYAAEIRLANQPAALVDRINLLLMAGSMDSTLRSQIIDAVESIDLPSSGAAAATARANRVKTAIYLTVASPAFAAQY